MDPTVEIRGGESRVGDSIEDDWEEREEEESEEGGRETCSAPAGELAEA